MGDIRRLSALTAAVLAAAVTGCGGSGDESASSPTAGGASPVHVHGLGINPADDSLFIAAHTGLFRAPPGKETSTRVADRYQDTMGSPWSVPITFSAPDIRTRVSSCPRCSA